MNQLTELLMYKTLHVKQSFQGNDFLLEHLMAQNPEEAEKSLQLKNVCAKISTQLADRLDGLCGLLDISKRRFIEAAIINALDEAQRVTAELKLPEAMQEREGE